METSELLKQLRIDKAARAPRARTGLLVVAGGVLLALVGGVRMPLGVPGAFAAVLACGDGAVLSHRSAA